MTTMKHDDDIYRRLRREIDAMPVPFPETPAGTELKLLKHLFTPEEAGIAVHLSMLPEPLEKVYRRLKKNGIAISREYLRKTLEGLFMKGAIAAGWKNEKRRPQDRVYSKAQLAIGMFEFQVDRITPDYARDFDEYMEGPFREAAFGVQTVQMRTIPIHRSIGPETAVEPCDAIRGIVQGMELPIAVMNCVCRQSREAMGHAISRPEISETCLMFGEAAQFFHERGAARFISKEECLQIIERAEAAGCVFQPQNTREPGYVCCCYPECCHALRGFRMLQRPADHVSSNYRAVPDERACTLCAKCIKGCPMGAIANTDGRIAVNRDRCIGCGICVGLCCKKAMRLTKKERVRIPPGSSTRLYLRILYERYGPAGMARLLVRTLTGRKL